MSLQNLKDYGSKEREFLNKIRRSVISSVISKLSQSVKNNNSEEDESLTFLIREGCVLNTKDKKAPEDFYVEEIDELPILIDFETVHNSDYEIELTQEELSNRVYSENDPHIKDFCITFHNTRYQTD